MRYCQYCGHPLEDGALFCTNCGKRIFPLEDRVESASDEDIEKSVEIDHESASFSQESSEEEVQSESSITTSNSDAIDQSSIPTFFSESTSNESTSESLSIQKVPQTPVTYEEPQMSHVQEDANANINAKPQANFLESISTVNFVRIVGIVFGALYVLGLILTFVLRSQISTLSSSYAGSISGGTSDFSSLASVISALSYLYYGIMIVGAVFIIITLYRFYKYRSETLDLVLFVGTAVDLFILKDVRPLVRAVITMGSGNTTTSILSALSGLSSVVSQASSYRFSLIVSAIIGLGIAVVILIGILQEKGTFFISHFFDFFGHYSQEKTSD